MTPSNGSALAHAWTSFPAAVELCPIEEAVISRSAARTVIYFFAKQDRFVQCEMHPGRPHVLTVIDADGVEHTERHSCVDQLLERWTEIHRQLARDGWIGPFGRDGRR